VTGEATRDLHFLGPGDPDHLDPASPYHIRHGQLLRALSRQLYAYPSTRDVADRTAGTVADTDEAFLPVPDVARGLPVLADGSLSRDLRTYTIALRDDVFWDTRPPRPVTADDFVRGISRLANPSVGGDARTYFAETVRGMREYCDAFDATFDGASPGAEQMREFRRAHPVAGLRAVDEHTLVFELVEPANDFVNMLATGFAAAVPAEHEAYPPGSPEILANAVSSGPYRVARAPRPDTGGVLVLEPNPAWHAESDPVRRRILSRIRVSPVPSGDAHRLVDSGQVDLAWPFGVVSWDAPDPARDTVPVSYPGFTLNPYLVFNLFPENPRPAVRDVLVRRAVAYGVDKAAVAEVFADLPGVAVRPLRSVLPPGTVGHSGLDPYPTPGDRGDPHRARALLAEAGRRDGVELVAVVRDMSLHRKVMAAVAGSLLRCGIALDLRYVDPAGYYRMLSDPDAARAGRWDIAEPGWTPDWHGNNGRAVTVRLLSGEPGVGTANYGGYRNARVDAMMARTLREPNLSKASLFWHQIDVTVMNDLPIVPILAFACRCCAARTAATGRLA